jgi:hypothetical protein
VAAADVLHERVSGADHPCRAEPFQTASGTDLSTSPTASTAATIAGDPLHRADGLPRGTLYANQGAALQSPGWQVDLLSRR